LPFDGYRAQRLFHHINLSYPGLQLIHEQPYIFIVSDFLSASECSTLLAKAHAGTLAQQLVGESEASARTSVGCVARRDEVPALRERIASLTNMPLAHLQPLKISCYPTGARFAEHCDAVDGAGPVDEAGDYYADAARVERGTRQCPHPGANRCVTCFIYLNGRRRGARTAAALRGLLCGCSRLG